MADCDVLDVLISFMHILTAASSALDHYCCETYHFAIYLLEIC